MASFRLEQTGMSTLDDDVSAIIEEYSIPNLAEITSESLLTKSQYAKVIFHDLLPCYPTDADICCRYSLTEGIIACHGDRIALYRVGWVSVHDHVQFEMAPVTNSLEEREFRVLFKAEVLPKDTNEFYQLCYVNVNDAVCGASVPFQFRHPVEEELCEIEEQEGLLVVRSTTAISEKKLRDAARMIDELESEKIAHEEKIHSLESTKESLALKVEELSNIKQRELQLQQNIHILEDEKTNVLEKLKCAEKHIVALNAKVESLNRDNSALNDLLKKESHLGTEELSQYKAQVDNMQQMLDAMADSKELASHALQCEQSKVMTLNIEHDKYKFRCQQMEKENKGLQLDLQQKKSIIDSLELALKQNEVLLESKHKDNEATMEKLQQVIKQVGQLQFELNLANETNNTLQLYLKQRDNQILMFDMEMKDLHQKVGCFDQLNEDYTNLKQKLRAYDEEWGKVNILKEENKCLQEKVQLLQTEISKFKEGEDKLSSKYDNLGTCHTELQDESCLVSLKSICVQDDYIVVQPHAQGECSHGANCNQFALSISELNSVLAAAETSVSLQNDMEQVKKLQSDFTAVYQKQNVESLQKSTKMSHLKCATTVNAPIATDYKHIFRTLKDKREKLEENWQDIVTKEHEFQECYNAKSKCLAAIEEDAVNAKTKLELAISKNQQAKNDLMLLNNRMVSIQQQILHDDQREGRDFNDNGDQERLERMSKRCHDLQCLFKESTSEIHDLKQNILVFNQEKIHIEEQLIEKPLHEKKLAEEKCIILEKLVNLDEKLILLREKEMFPNFKDRDALYTDVMNENFTLPLCETEPLNPDITDTVIISPLISTSEIKPHDSSHDFMLLSKEHELGASSAAKLPISEPFEKAIETGVCEGIAHGINTLKQQVSEQLVANSVTSSMESITSIEQKCAQANEDCQEQERVLQEDLAAALKTSVRKELVEKLNLEGAMPTMDADSGRSGVEADLKLRLDMAAEEYRKLYIQKLKLEKQLLKLQQKQMSSSSQSSSVISTEETSGFVCPICGVCFPPANRDSFTRHYEDHLF